MTDTHPVVIIGAGPAGLIAAETLAAAGYAPVIYERKSSPGRKFLLAGRGGLNLTHSEPLEVFLTRYGAAQENLERALHAFTPAMLRAWAEELGQKTFTGSSGRVFPESLKASPLLRAWLARLNNLGVTMKAGYQWLGWHDNALAFRTQDDAIETVMPRATLLALGGASWPHLGADGAWTEILKQRNIPIAPLRPANCGFTVAWSSHFSEKFAGCPLKTINLTFQGRTVPGEVMIDARGIEGGAVYALSAALRDTIDSEGSATLTLDLRPSQSREALTEKLSRPRGTKSFSTWLQKAVNLPAPAIGLLREADSNVQNLSPSFLAALVKTLPLRLTAPFAIDRAISTAGGVRFDALTEDYMLKDIPGTFAAGEMLDWEAPTGGYLLQATYATGIAAARGMIAYMSVK